MPIENDEPIILKEGEYSRVEAFFAGLLAQLPIYANTEKNRDRCIETPQVIDIPETKSFELKPAEHSTGNQQKFSKKLKLGTLPKVWEDIKLLYPLQPNASGNVEGHLEGVDFTLATYLFAYIDQFEKEMQDFISLNEAKLTELDLKDNAGFILDMAMLLSQAMSPLENRMSADEESVAVLSYSGVATNKFNKLEYMMPKPSGTLRSCCDAMRRLVSQMITRPIGQEKIYGGMLGPAPRTSKVTTEDSVNVYKPSQRMYELLDGREIDTIIKNAAIESVAVYEEPFLIPDACFSIQQKWSNSKIFYHILNANKNWLQQVEDQQVSPAFCRAIFQRLWFAIQQDSRCPQWLKDDNDFVSFVESVSDYVLWVIFQEKNIITSIENISGKREELSGFIESLLPIECSDISCLSDDQNELVTTLILADIVERNENISNKSSLLSILNSQLPFYSKLHFVAAIAKFMPKSWIGSGNKLLSGLANFIDAAPENIYSGLRSFIFLEKPESMSFKNEHHAFNYYYLRANQEKDGFLKTFQVLVPFLCDKGISCNLKRFFSKSSPRDVEIDQCIKYLDDLDISEVQKNKFKSFLEKIEVSSSYRDRSSSVLVFSEKNKYALWSSPSGSPATVVRSSPTPDFTK